MGRSSEEAGVQYQPFLFPPDECGDAAPPREDDRDGVPMRNLLFMAHKG